MEVIMDFMFDKWHFLFLTSKKKKKLKNEDPYVAHMTTVKNNGRRVVLDSGLPRFIVVITCA